MGKISNRILSILFVLTIVFASCVNYNLREIEEYSGLLLNDKIDFIDRIEEWDDFQGDGCAFLIFNIKNTSYKSLKGEVESKKWKEFDTNHVSLDFISEIDISKKKEKISRYLEDSGGFFLREQKNKEIRNVLIDTINHRLIYYYILF